MKHDTLDQDVPPLVSVAAARRSIFSPMLLGSLGVLSLVEAARFGISFLPLSQADSLASSALPFVLGCLAALVACYWMAKAIASRAVRPIQILLEQLDPADLDDFRWNHARPLRSGHIDADLKLLQRRSREITRRSRLVIDQLGDAREQANRQNLAKSHFLANMSHELRTPLNAILGYAMLLHEDASSAGDVSVMADLDRIQQAGRNLLGLINDILDLSKIDSGRAGAERVPIDIPALMAEIVSESASSPPNNNRFSLTIADNVGYMIGDPAKLRQCLSNLIGNAFKFTHEGTVSLQVASRRLGNQDAIEFAVEDTGIGIAPDQIGHLFDSFQQGDGRPTRHYGGAGLGLALVSRLARIMDGDCIVESELGKGSTFTIIVPLGDTAAEAARIDAPRALPALAQIVETPRAERTALVVDDDEAAIDLMQRWLSRMGYRVVCTTSADAVVELARAHRPDLILLDVLMPSRSGYDIMQELRADEEVSHIPTILITVDDDRLRGLRAGAADYLRKPVTEAQLRTVLDVYRIPVSGDILVIDDDDAAAELLIRTVAQVGFSTRRAADGRQGLEMARATRPDAIVLDLAMPAMDGFEVLAQLATIESLKDVPLIVVSAFDISLEEHRTLAASGYRFFPKAASTPREIAQSLKELVA